MDSSPYDPRPRGAPIGIRGAVLLALAGSVLLAATPARGDVVTDWNVIADTLSAPAGAPPQRARVIAMAQIAVHDALNSIDARYESYASVPAANAGASSTAAVGQAAYTVLNALVPSAALDNAYTAWQAGLAPCPAPFPNCIVDGKYAGEVAGNAILALRMGDGSATPHLPYSLAPAPGVYQRTPQPPLGALGPPPQFAGWAALRPFVLRSGSQFRADPGEIFDLGSAAYTREFAEVKRLGGLVSADRTVDQSEIARFWPAAGANGNLVTRVVVAGRGLDAWQHARLFALVNMANSDSATAAFDTKYAYNFWRPVTAIRAAAADGNPATEADASWLSYQGTPPYPDYTCGLTNAVGSTSEVLRRYFRTDALAYTVSTAPPVSPQLTRSYATLSAAEDEAVDARVFGGMHFRSGCTRGVIQGNQVGRFVFQHSLRPLKGKRAH